LYLNASCNDCGGGMILLQHVGKGQRLKDQQIGPENVSEDATQAAGLLVGAIIASLVGAA
jgi:hypothetical protein